MTAPVPALPVRLVVVGHVDHGKSTLIGRLLCDTGSVPESLLARIREAGQKIGLELAFVTDHFAEERRDEKTIDTTQVFFRHAGRQYVIIDTPGHAEFLKNMFTGASRADAALVVVDADEGVGRQTLAHCRVLGLLGVRFVIPMINKADKVAYSAARCAEVAAAVRDRLRDAGIDSQPPVPISALAGDNVTAPSPRMPWYSGPTLLDALERIPNPTRPADRPMRFAVQGAIDLDGRRLYLGRVEAGTIRAQQPVRVLPSGADNTVASVEVFGGERTSAQAGESVAVTLSSTVEPARGNILCEPSDPPFVSSELTGRVVWLADRPLARGECLEARVATRDVAARVERIADSFHSGAPDQVRPEAETLSYGEIGLVTLTTVEPLVWEPFARDNSLGTFVLARDGNVAGAGTFPDSAPGH